MESLGTGRAFLPYAIGFHRQPTNTSNIDQPLFYVLIREHHVFSTWCLVHSGRYRQLKGFINGSSPPLYKHRFLYMSSKIGSSVFILVNTWYIEPGP